MFEPLTETELLVAAQSAERWPPGTDPRAWGVTSVGFAFIGRAYETLAAAIPVGFG